MIFVTVGTQLGFPRLLDAVDKIAGDLTELVFAQTGCDQKWTSLLSEPTLSMEAMSDHFSRSRLVIGHAGIGTILAARAAQRPLIVVPRRAELGEHRNDHQLATARALEAQAGVWVAWQTDDLHRLVRSDLQVPEATQTPLHACLISTVRSFALS